MINYNWRTLWTPFLKRDSEVLLCPYKCVEHTHLSLSFTYRYIYGRERYYSTNRVAGGMLFILGHPLAPPLQRAADASLLALVSL